MSADQLHKRIKKFLRTFYQGININLVLYLENSEETVLHLEIVFIYFFLSHH